MAEVLLAALTQAMPRFCHEGSWLPDVRNRPYLQKSDELPDYPPCP